MKNMGLADRIARLIAVAAIAIAWRLGYLSETTAVVMGVVALAFLLTSLVGVCPAYIPFRFSTRSRA